MTEMITAAEFQEQVLESAEPVLVDFFATWCGPCKRMSPVIDEVAGEVQGAKVFKLDIDEAPEICQRFGIMSVPTFVVFKDGQTFKQATGIQSKQAILDMFE